MIYDKRNEGSKTFLNLTELSLKNIKFMSTEVVAQALRNGSAAL